MQPEKAPSPILSTVFGIETLDNELQPKKALSPIDITECGITAEVRFEQYWKVEGSILFKL